MYLVVRTIIILASCMMLTASSKKKNFDPALLERLEPERGSVRLNGIEDKSYLFSNTGSVDQFVSKIKKELHQKYTVTISNSGYSKVIIISKLPSKQCPKCPKPTAKTWSSVVKSSFVISYFPNHGQKPFAIGTNSGLLLSLKRSQYNGTLLKESKEILDEVSFSEYKFGKTYTSSLNAIVSVTPQLAMSKVLSDLKDQGYVSAIESFEESSSNDHQNRLETILVKGPSTVHIAAERQLSGGSNITISESITK